MKVLWVAHTSRPGGSTHSLLEGLRALEGRGVRSTVVAPEDGPLARALPEHVPFRILYTAPWLAEPGSGSFLFLRRQVANLRARRGMIRLVREVGPDVVVTNTLLLPMGAVAARAAGIPHVWHAREFGDLDHGYRFPLGRATTFRLVGELSARVVANSEALKGHLERWIPAHRLRRIYNAVEVPDAPRPTAPASGPRARLLLLGYRAPGKGTLDAIQALDGLHQEGVDAELMLVGQGSAEYDGVLREEVRRRGLEGRVEIHPFTKDPAAAIVRADVLLVCSTQEAFGRVTVEGMKLGTPVVASASGGTTEVVDHGRTGFLYPAGDIPALVTAVRQVLKDPARAAAMAGRARAEARTRFGLERYGRELHAVLEEAVLERPRAERHP